ncbi:putative phospho-2-dehydro-3-deoxyheptonate aldolase (aroG)/chorismate mutase (pheA) [Candidatus Walczuchella monophlebidarum]|uniref:chorismate mutase n=2 Tax=Candidatus Walczuchella monophlebidarum TaxID=1415657 RepID=A0A068DWU9_9FLAO|nr:putative phospho-2-dehydro-3-deoxyheptonate aldolase (aroG)/chorismate mutase (pheA) [Candidatus Walczuchella monophlebidarum]
MIMQTLNELDQDWMRCFQKPIIISGPCSAESQEQLLEISKNLDKSYVKIFRAGIWKPRTKPGGFEGVGEIGLKWLQKVKEETGMMIATEVANTDHVKASLAYDIDILWIGARSTVNPFTVQEIAESLKNTEKIILVKNPINPDFDLWVGALERLVAQGIKKIGVIHRGFSYYKKSQYRNHPHWDIALNFKNFYGNIPIICDPSHICGEREGIATVAKQALNLEYDGLMIESHCNPDKAWSDSKQQITPQQLVKILKKIEFSKEQDSKKTQIEILRDKIDELDENVLSLLASRFLLSREIGMLKKKHNVDIFQPNRWKQIMEKLECFGKNVELSSDFIKVFLEIIHQESIQIQNRVMLDR